MSDSAHHAGTAASQQEVVDRVAADGYYPDGSVKMSHVFALALYGCPPPPQRDSRE